MGFGIGKLVGKALGEVAAAPLTLGRELLDVAEEIPKQLEKAVDRAVEDKDEKRA